MSRALCREIPMLIIGRAASRQRLPVAAALRRLGMVIGIAMALAGPPTATVWAASALLTGARATADGPHATLEITLSSRAPYRVFTLPDPPRVVIDLDDVRLAVGDAQMPKPAGPIAAVRIGRVRPGTARLVVDLAGPAKVAGTRLSARADGKGHVLAVELAGRRGTVATQRLSADGRVQRQPVGQTGRPDGTPASPLTAASAAAPAIGAVPAARAAANERGRNRQRVVVIDPGHGGVDPGAVSRRGLYEKHVTLATAREIRSQLATLGSYRIVLTRNRDIFIPLRKRVAIARDAGADLLLSIHADKLDNHSVRGLSVYTLSERASDAEAAALAERENKADLLADIDLRGAAPDVTNILIALAQRDTMNHSAKLAGVLVAQARGDVAVLPNAHRFAGFAVLKAPDVPSVLIELGFLSNETDEAMLTSPTGRRKLARSVARGVDAYFTSVEVANRR